MSLDDLTCGDSPLDHHRAERDRLLRDIARLKSDRYFLETFVRSMLPTPFVSAYQALCDDIHKSVGSALGNVTDMPQAPRGNKKGQHDGGLKGNSRHINRRKNIDRRLRAIARDIRSAGQEPIRCPQCAKFIEDGWKHCAWCGKELQHDREVGRTV